jgi:hypothetical protein
VALRVDTEDRFTVVQQTGRRVTEILPRFSIGNNLPIDLIIQVDRLWKWTRWFRCNSDRQDQKNKAGDSHVSIPSFARLKDDHER